MKHWTKIHETNICVFSYGASLQQRTKRLSLSQNNKQKILSALKEIEDYDGYAIHPLNALEELFEHIRTGVGNSNRYKYRILMVTKKTSTNHASKQNKKAQTLKDLIAIIQ